MTKSDVTVAALDIARIAGVGRAAVSNWRRRYPDFPQPMGGTASSPLFSLGQVEGWLDQHGKPYRMTSVDRFWQRVRTTVDDWRLGELMGHVGALLVLVDRHPDAWARLSNRSDEKLATALSTELRAREVEVPGSLPDAIPESWAGIFKEAAVLAAADGPLATYERLCEQYLEIRSRRGATTPGDVAGLLVDVAAALVPDASSVLDPSCGTGTLLVAASATGSVRALGQDADDAAARITAARLLLGGGAGVRIEIGDAIRADAFPDETVDVVVCDPTIERSWGYDDMIADPRWIFGLPPRSESELAWLQHCLAHLRPGGVAVVVLPAAVASRRAGRRIRGNLLRAGAVRAVIGLPQGGSGLAGPRDLWVLVRPGDDEVPQHILMTDRALDANAVVAAWQAFLSAEPLPAAARAVRVIDLLDDEVDLSPARHLVTDKPSDVGEYVDLAAQWQVAVDTLRNALPAMATDTRTAASPVEAFSYTTVGELAKAGVVTVHQAPIRMDTDHGERPVLTARDVRHGHRASGLADLGPGAVELLPGDVVGPILREGRVRVVDEAGALLGPNLVMLRPDPDRIDPDFLAGCVRSAAHGSSTRSSGVSGRFDARRVSVPRLTIDEQRRWGTDFRKLSAMESRLQELEEVGERLIHLARLGLIHGGLRPGEMEEP